MNIQNNSIIIMPSAFKNSLIKKIREENKLLNVKFISDLEFIKKYYFDYNEKTCYYIMQKYKVNYEIANIYLQNIYYVIDSNNNNSKVLFLKDIYNDLINNDLLIIDKGFSSYLKTKNIYLYKKELLNEIALVKLDNFSYDVINENNNTYKLPCILEFSTIEEEVDYVANEIVSLIKNNVDINKIKLVGIDKNYINILKRTFKFYHLPLDLGINKVLYNTDIGLYFLKNLSDDFEVLNKIKENYNLDNSENLNIYNTIIDVLNNFTWTDSYLKIKEILIEIFKKTKIKSKITKNKISIVDLKEEDFNDEYVFVMNFSMNNIPFVYKDEDYLSSQIKQDLGYRSITLKNRRELENITRILTRIKNLTITFKKEDINGSYYISSLVDKLNLEVKTISFSSYKNSNLANKLKLAKMLDLYNKYGILNTDINILASMYPNFNYKTYTNDYHNINLDSLNKYLDNKLFLSYSSLNNYFLCPFKYYLANILNVNFFEDTYYSDIGSVFHEVLAKYEDSDFDIDKYFSKLKFNNLKEKFFYNKLKEDLKFIIDALKKQATYCSFNKSLKEEKVKVLLKDNVIFSGIIDKILYKEENDQTNLAIIDYKTGNVSLDLSLLKYGLNMQLPIYIYLILNYKKINNPNIVGIYLQELLNYDKKEEDLNSSKLDSLKLKGYSVSDKEILEKFDSNYFDSKMIKGLKINNDGSFNHNAKILNKDDFINIYNEVDDRIKFAISNIKKANFKINPKVIKGNNVSCKFCPYQDICYVKVEDMSFIEK